MQKRPFFYAMITALVACSLAGTTGCSREHGLSTSRSHIRSIKTILEPRARLGTRLDTFHGVALLRIVKAGVLGIGGQIAEATVYVRNPETGKFGPPAFAGYGGVSLGLVFGVLDIADCAILFEDRADAVAFAKRPIWVNFTNEASFFLWGAKQMTIRGGDSYSDGAGLCLGAIEGELYLGAAKSPLHKALYESDAPPEDILLGKVTIPKGLQASLDGLNKLMAKD